jgi:outer membrane protein assembly factor BamB
MDDGRVAFFDAETGRTGGEVSLGEPVRSCVMQVESLSRPISGERESLVSQIAKVIDVKETEMVMMQRFLLRELLAQPDEVATKKLIELASDKRTSPALVADVRAGVAARRNGANFMLEALGRRYDYLKDVLEGPPVGPLADALAAMGEKRAAPLLAEHILDPMTEPEDVKRAVMALTVLAGEGELGALQTFFRFYRCSEQEELAQSAVLAAKAIIRVGGDKVKAQLREVASDPLTAELVRESLKAMLRAGEGK